MDGAIALTDNAAKSLTWYAWVGDEDTTEFDTAVSNYASVKVSASSDGLGLNITPDTPEKSTTVDIGTDQSVTLTVQLIDTATEDDTSAEDAEDAEDVAKAGVTVKVGLQQGDSTVYPPPDSLTTDADGQVTFTITGPTDDEDDAAQTRDDVVTFTIDMDDDTPDDDPGRAVTITWAEDAVGTATRGVVSAPDFAVRDDGEVTFRATVNYYDKYGKSAGSRSKVTFTATGLTDGIEATIKSNGSASVSVKELTAASAAEITVDITSTDLTGVDVAEDMVTAVDAATKGAAGPADEVDAVYKDDDKFRIDGTLFSYDSNDTFLSGGKDIDMDEFEKQIQETGADVQVVIYSSDSDKTSIFVVSNA